MRARIPICGLVALVLLTPVAARAQSVASDGTHPWLVIGGGSTTLSGDCTNCEEGRYQHTGGLLVNGGVSLSQRTDVGAEVLWVPAHLPSGPDLRTTFVMPAVQFRPWRSAGFFVKAGAGFAFVRNWVVDLESTGESPPFISAAFGLGIGGGWEWRTRSRFGLQLLGRKYAANLRDVNPGAATGDDVT